MASVYIGRLVAAPYGGCIDALFPLGAGETEGSRGGNARRQAGDRIPPRPDEHQLSPGREPGRSFI